MYSSDCESLFTVRPASSSGDQMHERFAALAVLIMFQMHLKESVAAFAAVV